MAHGDGRHRSTLTSELVQRAAAGDHGAWNVLVERYSGMLWSIARAYDLGRADAMDVVQTTWLRLVEHVHRMREPDRVGTWLAVTARRESLRTVRLLARERVGRTGVPGPDAALSAAAGAYPGVPPPAPGGAPPRALAGGAAGRWSPTSLGPPAAAGRPDDPAEVTVARDRQRRLLATISRLPERCRRLLRMLSTVPPATYAEISAALDMPIGSIGPTRARCLAHVRKRLAGRKP